MPGLNWDAFGGLPGSAESNFELLCRGLVRRHYGQYGAFRSLAAQPGVEFHLKIERNCPALGGPGRWYGWQCRWWELESGASIGSSRKAKIVHAIATTQEILPDLTDWVLWTRRPLTKRDQEWYFALPTGLSLHLWTADQVEEHLSGPAEILRGTYFGELVLTPDALLELHGAAVAPIRHKWLPEAHQPVDAERRLRRALGEAERWDVLGELAGRLRARAADIDEDATRLDASLVDAVAGVAGLARQNEAVARGALRALGSGDLDHLQEQLAMRPPQPAQAMIALPRRLRAWNSPAALPITNVIAHAAQVACVLDDVSSHLRLNLVAVVADAGCGKTQLAAQLTAPKGERPAGILLHGRDLHANHSLDDLAHSVVVQGSPVQSMEALIAALDAAGQRAGRRLPIVVDGLNEAEDPRRWKRLLPSLDKTLDRYPYVLVVCTTRGEFVKDALPAAIQTLETHDFGHDTHQAVSRYFDYYKIDRGDADLPWGLVTNPLMLRLFCEVTNPTREAVVALGAMPESLTALFGRYLVQASERVVELAPRDHQFSVEEVRSALGRIGTILWDEGTRGIVRRELRQQLGEDGGLWCNSMVRALEHEGVLVGLPGEGSGDVVLQAVFDALAGHLAADALLQGFSADGLVDWLRRPETTTALAGSVDERHPLAGDIAKALAGLVPRRFAGMQFWKLVDEPLRTQGLLRAAELEAEYLDSDTVGALVELAAQAPTGGPDLFERLRHTRRIPGHPLNAGALDTILRPMAPADRDLRWTEWVRRRRDYVMSDLVSIEKQWRETGERTEADLLCARWAMWILTSTVAGLRDQATRCLYWLGRGDPSLVFELTLDALPINDPYVGERMLAASYGVVMSHQLPAPSFGEALAGYVVGLRNAFLGSEATCPTSHWLWREYVRGTILLARHYYPDAVPEGLEDDSELAFAPGLAVDPLEPEDARGSEVSRTLHMDFENYTLGRLSEDRGNHDFEHEGHEACVAHVLGTVWHLGWRQSRFGSVDEDLAWHGSRRDKERIERYGKKYGWIGFYTYAGEMVDSGRLRADRRLSDLQIDPSFPEAPSPAPSDVALQTDGVSEDDQLWISRGVVTAPDALLYSAALGPHPGPWMAAHGHLTLTDELLGRQTWALLQTMLVDAEDVDLLVDALIRSVHPGRWWLPEAPSDYYTFAGEIPWSPVFAVNEDDDRSTAALYRRSVQVDEDRRVGVEVVAHQYSWESYHSHLNVAGGALVPSKLVSETFDLRRLPESFDQASPDGALAALSLAGPSGTEGHLLYVREDILREYAGDRCLVWLVWGERGLYPYRESGWLANARQENKDVWKRVARAEELSGNW